MASLGHLDTIADAKKTGPKIRELEKFANSLTTFLRRHNFDGLHMHWTYQNIQDRPYDELGAYLHALGSL